VKDVLERGDSPVVFDRGGDPHRLRLVLDDEQLARVRFERGDVTSLDDLRGALERTGARRIVHLAGLQVPFCKADPPLGAAVNVVGTVNVFEAAKALGIERVVYASSAAVYGPDDDAPAPDETSACEPATHYGVYKCAHAGNARIYWQDDGISSCGLRPLTVYGVGRDQGLTSGPTVAMLAAVLGRAYTIPFSGSTDLNYAADTAAAFVECALRAPNGANVYNLHGVTADVARIADEIARYVPDARIDVQGPALPIPPELDGSALEAALPGLPRTSLEDGVRATLDHFRDLLERGRIGVEDLSP
jgi:nucleoside-diphosphate-sugar epimerase